MRSNPAEFKFNMKRERDNTYCQSIIEDSLAPAIESQRFISGHLPGARFHKVVVRRDRAGEIVDSRVLSDKKAIPKDYRETENYGNGELITNVNRVNIYHTHRMMAGKINGIPAVTKIK